MTYEQQVINLCTRGGSIQWQNVANILGLSVETARARHDATYRRAPPKPSEPPPMPTMPKPDFRGKSNVAAIRRDIIDALRVGPLKAREIYARLQWSDKTVQTHLSALREVGRIRHDRETALWSLSEAG